MKTLTSLQTASVTTIPAPIALPPKVERTISSRTTLDVVLEQFQVCVCSPPSQAPPRGQLESIRTDRRAVPNLWSRSPSASLNFCWVPSAWTLATMIVMLISVFISLLRDRSRRAEEPTSTGRNESNDAVSAFECWSAVELNAWRRRVPLPLAVMRRSMGDVCVELIQ